MTAIHEAGRRTGAFVHEGFFYADDDAYLAGTIGFIQAGLDDGGPVLVAVPGRQLDLIRRAMGAPPEVRFLDMAQNGRNPGRIIPYVLNAFIGEHSGRRPRIIGEPIWAGRSSDEYPACVQHEALINDAFASRDAVILCPYDTRSLSPEVIADAHATHPILVDTSGRRASADYAPAGMVSAYNLPLPEPTGPFATMAYDFDTMPELRPFVSEYARRVRLDDERIADLHIAVTELATNSVRHADGGGTLRIWHTERHVVCEVRDNGWLADPLTGRLPPAPEEPGGRGLMIVNALCDLVRIHTTPGGTAVRLYLLR